MTSATPFVDISEDSEGKGAESKPKAASQGLFVKRSADRIVEIKTEKPEASDDWELISNVAVDDATDDPPLSSNMATRYRATTARLNYVASDWVDIQYAVKEC